MPDLAADGRSAAEGTGQLHHRLREILPGCEVLSDRESLDRVNTATFATTVGSSLIVRPTRVEDIVALVRFAGANRLSVHTASRGRNWGLGSWVPVRPVTVLLDLSRMDRVLDYGRRQGTLRVEPGVSFGQASRFLVESGNRHFIGAIGGSPDASLLGNVLERGDGAGPLWDRASHACAFEVVLADGTLVHTGYGNREGSRLAALSRSGVGPGAQDLFLQSNLGIVTKMTLLLARRPRSFGSYSFRVPDHPDLAPILERLRRLLQRRILSGPIVFWNDYKQMAASSQYPWAATGNETPLHRDRMRAMSNAWCAWVGSGAVHIDHPRMNALALRELRRALRHSLGPDGVVTGLTEPEGTARQSSGPTRGARPDRAGDPADSPLLGAVGEQGVRAQYWRKRRPPPEKADPDQDRCGVLWNAFELPLEGRLVVDLMARLDTCVLGHGFEPMTSLAVVDERRAKCFLQLVYDREVPGEDARAWSCHQELFETLETLGFTHTRVDIRHMAWMREHARSTVLRDRIAHALDPAGVLSPGRYEF